MSKHYHKRNEAVLLLITGGLSIEEEFINVADFSVNFYDKSKFENNVIHKSKNGLDWICSDNENKHKSLHRIFDDNDDDDDDDDHHHHHRHHDDDIKHS